MAGKGNSRPALFLDRDGIVVRNVNDCAPRSADELTLETELLPILREAAARGFELVVVSNQPDYALGNVTFDERAAIEEKFRDSAQRVGLPLRGIYYCYHHERAIVPELRSECECRKPRPGLLLKAAQDLALDLRVSLMLGDRGSDIKAGSAAGVRTILFDPSDSQGAHLKRHSVRPDFTARTPDQLRAILEGVTA